jgi:YHS domain-containing protein
MRGSKMKRIVGVVVALASMAFVAVPVTGYAAATQQASKKVVLVCPVTGNKIPSIAKAVGHSLYKGKTYYFCCKMCKPLFDKDPQKYLNKKTPVQPAM